MRECRQRVIIVAEITYRIIDSILESFFDRLYYGFRICVPILGGGMMLLIAQVTGSSNFLSAGAAIAPLVKRIPDLKCDFLRTQDRILCISCNALTF